MGTFPKKSLYGRRESAGQELKFLKMTQMQQLAGEVLDIYNNHREEDNPSNNTKHFFDALDAVWREHHFHDQRLAHEWHDKKFFHKEIIPVCHSLQPIPARKPSHRKKSSSKKFTARKQFSKNEEEYIQSVIEDIEYILKRKMESEFSFREALSFAVKSTWEREEESSVRKNLWKSKKSLKNFFKKYYEAKVFLNGKPSL